MKVIIAMLAFLLISQAQAQTNAEQTVVETAQAQAQTQAPKQEQAAAQSQTAPIYIMNSQKFEGSQDSAQVQSQPVTVVQDSPLIDSASNQVRKKRQTVEAATEDGIVTALEKARLQDELRRREKFNNAISVDVDATAAVIAPTVVAPSATVAPVINQGTVNQGVVNQQGLVNQAVVQQNVQQSAVQQVVDPTPAVDAAVVVTPAVTQPSVVQVVETVTVEKVEAKPVAAKVEVRNEIREELAEAAVKHEIWRNRLFMAGLVGFGNYPDVRNIRGNMSAGFSLGMETWERVVIEGSFLYGNYELEDLDPYTGGTPQYPRIVDMRQYNFTTGVKYQLNFGMVRPNVGALAGYTRRAYSEWDFEFQTTDAFDVGLSAGVDVEITRNFAVGLDFRYMTNLTYSKETDYRESFVYPVLRDEPESLDYYTSTLTGKFTF